MPICIPDSLPAVDVLRNENVFVMTSSRAKTQEIRPLKLLFLNLMPKKIETENQFLRLLSNSSLQVNIQLLRIDQRESKNTPIEHLNSFYCDFKDIHEQNFDGLIITGAPLGKVAFSDVVYWSKLAEIIIWAKEHVTSIMFVCWAVQAALKVLYDLPKFTYPKKLSGVYQHQIIQSNSILTRGFDDTFLAPHSRNAAFPIDKIRNYTDLTILAESDITGPYLMATADKRLAFVTGHPEYDSFTLANEYYRDLNAGINPEIPYNYFPDNNPNLTPKATWRSHAYLLFSNWLNYYVYQLTPFDLATRNMTIDD